VVFIAVALVLGLGLLIAPFLVATAKAAGREAPPAT